LRDFVSVEDVVKVNMFFLDHPGKSGIFNLGTGSAQSFNDVAVATINTLRAEKGEGVLTLEQMHQQQLIRYIPFPEQLKGKYQSYTQADMTAMREIGYAEPFLTVEQGTSRYVSHLLKQST
jgi:ADP-L-glycero-D-manno-heptose 6-epimerase